MESQLAGRPQGSVPRGLDFNRHMRRLCVDITGRLDELAHIDMARVAIRVCQARNSSRYGMYASLTPMRFAGGAPDFRRRGTTWTVQRIYDASGREMLYLLSFYLPRFLNRTLEHKLATVVHELWHISTAFDGDLRRHPGRCYAHSHSREAYDDEVRRLSQRWLSLGPPPETYEFLRFDFRQLEHRYGGVVGQRISTPKLIRARDAGTRAS
jgi:hypothetical protein